MSEELVSIFLDTNCVLHFVRFDQIDWLDLTGSGQCHLVVCPILLRELEKSKVFNSSPKLRERAASVVTYLASLIEQKDPVFVRDRVAVEFVDHDALIDFRAHRLIRELSDDQLIASAIEYQTETGHRTLIASDDAGLRIKLRSRAIEALKLPEAARLPPVVDAERSEVLELKRQVARLQTRSPRLGLVFDDGSKLLRISRTECPDNTPRSLSEIMAANPLRPIPPEETYDRYAELRGAAHGGLMLVRMVAEQHNQSLESYFSKYRKFLKKYDTWKVAMQTMYDAGFILKNDGNGPATNVDVRIIFPNHIKLLGTDSFPMEPDEPVAPGASDADTLLTPMHDRLFRQSLAPLISPHYDGRPSFEKGGRTLEYDAQALKHGCDLTCESVWFQIPLGQFDPFELDVSITYNEGDKVEQKLAIVFEN